MNLRSEKKPRSESTKHTSTEVNGTTWPLLSRKPGPAARRETKNSKINSDCRTTVPGTRPSLVALASGLIRLRCPIRFQKKGKGKGKGGGKGQQENKNDKNPRPPASSDNRTLHREHNGQQFCFPFNNKRGCTRKKCDMLHVCQICLGDKHGAISCPSA